MQLCRASARVRAFLPRVAKKTVTFDVAPRWQAAEPSRYGVWNMKAFQFRRTLIATVIGHCIWICGYSADSGVNIDTVAKRSAPGQARELVLGPGDELIIWAVAVSEISDKPITVDEEGSIDLPLIGTVHAGGLTTDQLRQELVKRFKQYVNDPQVSVTVTARRSRAISVIGAVNHPGVYQIRPRGTVLDGLSLAGGLAPDAGQVVNILRSEASTCGMLPNASHLPDRDYISQSITLKELLDMKTPASNVIVCP